MSADAAPGPRLTALKPEAAAALLRRAGAQHVDVAGLHADIAAGAPLNGDGTINLLMYGAWLVRELARRDGGHGG